MTESHIDESKSLGELMNFLQANIEKTKDPTSGRFCFTARVAYHSHSATKTFNTTVTVETDAWSGGKTSILEAGQCPSSSTHHLDFTPKFQKMRYDHQSNILVVNGSSQKMAGDYQVTIIAL